MNLSKSIILVGIKHSGKSTQGKELAKHFGIDFFDTDDVIKELTTKSPREIYNNEGKESFLGAEKLACKFLNSKLAEKPIIVATGGGICENQDALRFLNLNSIFVYLSIDESIAIERILSKAKTDGQKIIDQDSLPSYIAKKNPHTISDVRNYFHNFYDERTKKYSMLADITINQEKKSIKEITSKIISCIEKI